MLNICALIVLKPQSPGTVYICTFVCVYFTFTHTSKPCLQLVQKTDKKKENGLYIALDYNYSYIHFYFFSSLFHTLPVKGKMDSPAEVGKQRKAFQEMYVGKG